MADIEGVKIEELVTYPDERGYFREVFRTEKALINKVAQASATMSYPGVIKAWHYHKKQDDLWYVAKGMIQAVLYDKREKSRTKGQTQVVMMGDHKPVNLFIPKGVVHGYKVVGNEPALVIYATNKTYDPDDELRIDHDDPEIGYDWTVKPR